MTTSKTVEQFAAKKKAATIVANGDKETQPQKFGPRRVLSKEEQKDFLKEYLLVKPDFWHLLRANNRIAYVVKNEDGSEEFNTGGLVGPGVPVKLPSGEAALLMKNVPSKNMRGYVEWTVPFSTIVHIYLRMTVVAAIIHADLKNVVSSLNTNIKTLAEHIKKLSQRIKAVEKK